MTDIRLNDELATLPAAGEGEAPRGGGSTMLVAIAAALAVVIAIIAAAAMTVAGAAAAPVVEGIRVASAASGADAFTSAVLYAGAPTRDAVYQVVSAGAPPHRSLAMILVGALFIAAAVATRTAWRALGRSLAPVEAPRRRVRD